MQVQFLGWEDPLEEEMAIHTSTVSGNSHRQRILASYSPWGHKRVRHDLLTEHTYTYHQKLRIPSVPEKVLIQTFNNFPLNIFLRLFS